MRTLLGFEHHHLIDFFHRHQGSSMARVARLTAATALTPRTAWTCVCGGSLDGGREEFREVWLSCSCNARTCSCNVDHAPRSPHALRVPEYRLALRVGSVPTPRVVMQAVFPWRQGMLCGDGIASVKFSLPERLSGSSARRLT